MAQVEELRSHELTSGLTQGQVASLASLAIRVEFEADELILAGRPALQRLLPVDWGKRSGGVVRAAIHGYVEALGAGKVFGWSSLLDWHDTLFQVRARDTPPRCAWKAMP